MGVILKRMMVRAASKVAERYGVQALVTGEALGQVSSQTLTNLRLIDNVSDTLIPASADFLRQRAHHQPGSPDWHRRLCSHDAGILRCYLQKPDGESG